MEQGLNEAYDCQQSAFAHMFEQYGLECKIVAVERFCFCICQREK